MKIKVTEHDISEGVRRDASNCAVARALRRAGIAHAGVAGTLVLLARGARHEYVVLPGRVQEWIAEFDAGGNARPIEFELPIPDWVAQHSAEAGKNDATHQPGIRVLSVFDRNSMPARELVLEA
jgi:hypothetical protein